MLTEAQRRTSMAPLFIFLCFTGVFQVTMSIPRKYYLIQQGKTWSDAQTYCRANYADLATIGDSANMVRLQQDTQFSSSAWVGLYVNVNSWKWSIGNTALGSYQAWDTAALEPNNIGGNQECGGICPTGWFDIGCSSLLSFVCYDATYPQLYAYYTDLRTWADALTYCRQHHTDLAISRTSAENSLLLGLISGYTWMGLFRDSWKWSDQTSISTIPWQPAEPNNAGGSDTTGFLFNFQAYDAPNSNIHPFFCYKLITGQRRIVRFKVQSDLDVNDPVIEAAILVVIQKKLKEFGLSKDILVKWRHEHGQVFKIYRKG